MRYLLYMVLLAAIGGCDKSGPETQYTLYVNAENDWKFTVHVNGVPIIREELTSGRIRPLWWEIVDGRNTLKVRAELRGDPRDARGFEVGLLTTDLLRLDKVRSDEEVLSAKPAIPGQVVEKEYQFEAAIPFRRVWQEAPVIKRLTGEDRMAIQGELTRVYDALRDRDTDKLFAVLEVAMTERQKAMGLSDVSMGQQEAGVIKAIQNARMKVEMRDLKELSIVPYGRLVVVDTVDRTWEGTWIIRMEPAKEATGFESLFFDTFVFAKIEGRWMIVVAE